MVYLILSCQDDFHDITEEDEDFPDFEDHKWLTAEGYDLLQHSVNALNDLSQSLHISQRRKVNIETMVQ